MNEEEQKVVDEFVVLVERSQQLFNGLRDLPQHGDLWHSYYEKTFEVFSKLWKFQQVNRAVLENKAGYSIKRWEIGEVASKIGQLYYHYYLRTSETNYLYEAFMFYDAIRSRKYFHAVMEANSATLMVKKLRFCARFIVVCMLLDRVDMVRELIAELSAATDEYVKGFKPRDGEDWLYVLKEINSFVNASNILTISGEATDGLKTRRMDAAQEEQLIRTIGSDDDEEATGDMARPAPIVLQEAVVVGNRHNQVKFSELTVDMFRMVQALEKEPVPVGGVDGNKKDAQRQDRLVEGDRYLKHRDNPRKSLLFTPTFEELTLDLAAHLRDMRPRNALLIYVSGTGVALDGSDTNQIPMHYARGGVALNCSARTALSTPSMAPQEAALDPAVLFPSELVPYGRVNLFIIVESTNSFSFSDLPNPFGNALLCLMSPQQVKRRTDEFGNLFTMFLHDPLAAFCFVVDVRTVEESVYESCHEKLSETIAAVPAVLRSVPDIDPSIIAFLDDVFLARFIARFIFCRVTLALHKELGGSPLELPQSHPRIPRQLFQHPLLADAVFRLAAECDVVSQFHSRTEMLEQDQ